MENSNESAMARAIAGCVWGTTVGDAIGLPCEGLSPARIQTLFGGIPDGHRLLLGRGMVSDDTEHTLLVWEALAASAGDGEAFTRSLAHGLRRWVLTLPAGVGLATLRAGLRLVFGVPPTRSGVFSAGNGPAMRAALLGVVCAWDDTQERLQDLVSRSSRLTHTDPKAEYGALAVAVCAGCFARQETRPETICTTIADVLPTNASADELRELLHGVVESVQQGETTQDYARRHFPNGVSGYVYQTVPVALHAISNQTFRHAVRSTIACGGDTDTVAAIVGGIVGASIGAENIPEDWRQGIWEPTGILAKIESWSELFANHWHSKTTQTVPVVPYLFALLRNVVFATIVLWHGFNRLLRLLARPERRS